MNPKGADKPCPFQHCCANFSAGENGNCVAEFDDILECWVDTTDPKTLNKERLEGYNAFHGIREA